ncbi:hypothetical protein ACWD4G_30950 [Streptomyces sp. NPDC002643]
MRLVAASGMEAAPAQRGIRTCLFCGQRLTPPRWLRLFSLIEAAFEAVHAYTTEPPGKPATIRDELMVNVQNVDADDIEAVRSAIAEPREQATADLAHYARRRNACWTGALLRPAR